MLVTGHADVKDITTVSVKEILEYNYGIVEPVLEDTDLTINTIENTLAKFGIDVDLNYYDDIATDYLGSALDKVGADTDSTASELGIKAMRHALNNIKLETVKDEPASWAFDASYPISILFDKVNGQDM